MTDLKKQSEDVEKAIESSTGVIQEALHTKLKTIQDEINEEWTAHFTTLQMEVQSSFNDISEDLQKVDQDLAETMDLIHETYEIVLDTRYKQGIELIEDAHKIFLKGSHNLKNTIPLFENFMIELQTTAIGSLGPSKVKQYLTALCKLKGVETAKIVFNYIIVVKAKYLQLVSVFYTYRNDLIRVEDEFKCFNSDFEQLQLLHLKLFNEKFNPENCPDVPSDLPLTMVPMETITLEQKSIDDESNGQEDDFKKSKNEANGEELQMIPLYEGNNFVPSKKSTKSRSFPTFQKKNRTKILSNKKISDWTKFLIFFIRNVF